MAEGKVVQWVGRTEPAKDIAMVVVKVARMVLRSVVCWVVKKGDSVM